MIEYFKRCELVFTGTVKRGTSAPFDYGDRRHTNAACKLVPEKGIRYDLWAKHSCKGSRQVYLCYRESSTPSGRVCMATTNSEKLGPGRWDIKSKNPGVSVTEQMKRMEVKVEKVSEKERCQAMKAVKLFESSSVTVITVSQSEDPQWFVARAGRFTSTTALSTLKSAWQTDLFLSAHDDDTGLELIWKIILKNMEESVHQSLLSARRGKQKGNQSGSIAKDASRGGPYTKEMLNAMTKDQLLRVIGRSGNLSRRKSEIVQKILELQFSPTSKELREIGASHESKSVTQRCEVERKAIRSWAFRPIRKTEAMEVGSSNEINVLHGLAGFFKASSAEKVLFLTRRGLVASKDDRYSFMATSPDGIICLKSSNMPCEINILEIKTFSGAVAVGKSESIRHRHGPIIYINLSECAEARVSEEEERNFQLFQEVVTEENYRYQILHHAAVYNHQRVLFVAATKCKILFVCKVRLPRRARCGLRKSLLTIKTEFFTLV